MRKTIALILGILAPFLIATPAHAAGAEKRCDDQHDPFGARTCLRIAWDDGGDLTQIRVTAEGATGIVLGFRDVDVTGGGVYWWNAEAWNGTRRTTNHNGEIQIVGKRITYNGVVILDNYPDDRQTITFIVG